MSSTTPKPPIRFPPLIIPPHHTHKTTLIILHGRGSTAQKFAEPLLTHLVSPLPTASTSPPKPFQSYFPHTRFIIPTAPLRRAVAFNRSLIHQWFDTWSITQPEVKQHLQMPGLRETTAYLHDLLDSEIEQVGKGKVVLMGLSQGAAASLVAGVLWEVWWGCVGICRFARECERQWRM